MSVTQRPPIPGAFTTNSSACCPSECKWVDKIPLDKSTSLLRTAAPAPSPKITETPRPRSVMSNPVDCTSEPITKIFLYIPVLIY